MFKQKSIEGRIQSLLVRFIQCAVLFLLSTGANAQTTATLPEGMLGWWYHIGVARPGGYAATPEEACSLSAKNHWGTPLVSMSATHMPSQFACFYKNPVGGLLFSYAYTDLHCKSGYTPKADGICVKWAERSRPQACKASQAGFAIGNPVVVSSGAKLHAETDLPGLPNGLLRVDRTYRTMREYGGAQSAGLAWSFSFDRQFSVHYPLFGSTPNRVRGAYGDGSFFEFNVNSAKAFVSTYDKRETLVHLDGAYTEWLLTRADGSLERFKKIGGKFLLLSVHTREGLGQTYTYTPDNKLATVTEGSGRMVTLAWSGDVVESITGASGSVRYRYELMKAENAILLTMTRLLVAVDFHDAIGRLISSRQYHYDDPNYSHLLTGITDENGDRFANYAYNGSAQTILSEHAGGANRHTFDYPEKLRRIITDPLGTVREVDLNYASDALGRVAGANQPAGAGCDAGSNKLTYDLRGRLASSTDFNGTKSCVITEPVRGLVTSQVTGLTAAAVCPANDTAPIASGSRRVSSQWHPDLDLETAVASPKQIARYVYNGQADASGRVASCAENAVLPNGKPIAVLCTMSVQATLDGDGAVGFAAQPDGRPRIWQYNYNTSGQLLKRTGPADAKGLSESLSLAYYSDTTVSHTKGDLASTKNSAGELTQFLEYTKDGLASKVKRADGVTVSLVYGPQQRLASRSLRAANGTTETTQYAYDDAGQLIKTVYADGSSLTRSYDGAHRLTGLKDGAGNRIAFTLDNMGNVTRHEVLDAAGKLVQESNSAFDALNRLASVHGTAKSAATTYQYDRSGNLTAFRDALGRVTSREYDLLDRMAKTILPPAAQGKTATAIAYGFDLQDNLSAVTDPRKLTTRYTVDGYGQRKVMSSPDTGTTNDTFDDAGNLVSRRDARSITTAFGYDAAQRVTKIGANIFEYGKDGSSAAGQLVTMIDASGKSSFSYDGFGRLQTKIQTVGSGTTTRLFTLSYKYGASGSSTGHVTSMTYPSGSRIDIGYAADGQPSSLTLVAATAATPVAILSNIKYAAFGAVQSWTWGGPTATNLYRREFDAEGRIKSYPLGRLGSGGHTRTLSYDLANRIKSMVHTGTSTAPALNQTFSYDDLDRLTGVDSTGVKQAFEYDANGNRIKATFGTSSHTNTIDAASNRLSRTSGPAPAKVNIYDNAGNLTTDGSAKFTYGADGRLSTAEKGGVTTRYSYNGFGQRVAKSGAAGSLTHYVYDGAGRLIGEYDGNGVAIQETVYLGDLPVAVLKRGVAGGANQTAVTEVYHVYADHILTPRVITRASDNRMVWRWDHADPFGLLQPDEVPGGLAKFIYNPRFPGQVYDKETNLHYNYFRDYDPQTGRYVQSDPIGLDGGLNTYGYVGANPLSRIDPTGEFAILIPFIPAAVAFAKATLFVGSAGAVAYGAHELTKAPAIAQEAKKNDDCDCGPLTRTQAMVAAQAWAQVPRASRTTGANSPAGAGPGRTPIDFSSLNSSSRGPNFNNLQARGASGLGYSNPVSPTNNYVFDHPDGHDDDNADHHKCPHIHAYHPTNGPKIFRYKAG